MIPLACACWLVLPTISVRTNTKPTSLPTLIPTIILQPLTPNSEPILTLESALKPTVQPPCFLQEDAV